MRIGPDGDLRDHEGHFEDAYALDAKDMILVRPDGYVAAIVDADDLPGLEAYFSDVGLGSWSASAPA